MSEYIVPDKFIAEDKSDPPRRIMLALESEDPLERAAHIDAVASVIERDDEVRLAVNRPDDIKATARVARSWEQGIAIDVGESGTVLRLFGFRDHHEFTAGGRTQHRTFIRRGTLATRSITEPREVYGLLQRELLQVDNGTSQFASAAVLLEDQARLPGVPYRLQQTYDMVDEWYANGKQLDWGAPLKEDASLRKVAESFARLMRSGSFEYEVTHSEEVTMGLGFGTIGFEEAEKLFPSVLGHESNRIVEMHRAMRQLRYGEVITSNDHRVVQTIAMLALYNEIEPTFANFPCVAKSWPLFGAYLDFAKSGA